MFEPFFADKYNGEHNKETEVKRMGYLSKLYVRLALLWDEKGATAVEYGLIVALIAVAIIGAVMAMSGALQDIFDRIAAALGAA
jgi:pilus assembly protein Flp/PilA